MKRLTQNKNGFTLIEVLIALFIFAIGILGVATMQIKSIEGNSKSRLITEASNAGSDRIEKFFSLAYDDPALADTDGDGTNQDADYNGTDDNGGNFGLDDFNNPDGYNDVNADGAPDDQDGDGKPDLCWNIAVGYPLDNTKTIKVIVDPIGSGKSVEITYIKDDII